MGKRFTEPPPFNLKDIFKDSNPLTPLIFVLTPGSAPFALLQDLAE
jgi:dynein heavy chain